MYWQNSAFTHFIVAGLICGLGACKSKTNVAPKAAPPTIVDVIVAKPQSISNTLEANGTIVANEYVELHPEVSGRLTFLNVPEGSPIAQGTILARINDADLQAQLAKSKVQLDLAQKTEERYKQLLAVNGINQSDYDAVLNQVNSLKADINYTQTLIDKTVIRAPFSGIIGLRQVSPGAFVTPSGFIATLQQVDRVKIDFTLPEEYSYLIKKGNMVEIEPDALNPVRKKAVIVAAEPQVNLSSRNIVVRAVLQGAVANPGAFVKVYVSSGVDKRAILVPTNAIIPDDKNSQVVVVKNGKAVFVNVKTGIRQTSDVEIIAGVKAGDSVVVTGVLFARPNTPLKVRSVKTLEQLTSQ